MSGDLVPFPNQSLQRVPSRKPCSTRAWPSLSPSMAASLNNRINRFVRLAARNVVAAESALMIADNVLRWFGE